MFIFKNKLFKKDWKGTRRALCVPGNERKTFAVSAQLDKKPHRENKTKTNILSLINNKLKRIFQANIKHSQENVMLLHSKGVFVLFYKSDFQYFSFFKPVK